MAILMSFFVAIGFCGGLVASSFAIFPVPDAMHKQAPFLFTSWQAVETTFWLWMLAIAIGASLALSLMTHAYQIAKTSYAAIYEYAYLLSVGIFGWIFWSIVPDLVSIAGIMHRNCRRYDRGSTAGCALTKNIWLSWEGIQIENCF